MFFMLKRGGFKLIGLILIVTLLASCFNGLEPLPDEVGALDLSLSIPVAKATVGLDKTYSIGPPNWFLNQNVPGWAKYDFIYYSDTLTVDLYRIYEKSEEISYLAFNINIWNEFPVSGSLEMSFIDPSNVVLYSFSPVEIESSDILFNGNVVHPGYSNGKVEFDKALIEKIRTADRLVYYMKINLKDGNTFSFQYFDQFTMKCYLGARVDFVLKDI